jgi:hypothetical protein
VLPVTLLAECAKSKPLLVRQRPGFVDFDSAIIITSSNYTVGCSDEAFKPGFENAQKAQEHPHRRVMLQVKPYHRHSVDAPIFCSVAPSKYL